MDIEKIRDVAAPVAKQVMAQYQARMISYAVMMGILALAVVIGGCIIAHFIKREGWIERDGLSCWCGDWEIGWWVTIVATIVFSVICLIGTIDCVIKAMTPYCAVL